MITLPDGKIIKMQWKQVMYIRGKDFIVFEVVPMLTEKDIIIFPSVSGWLSIQDVFSLDERNEIIFLLERIAWKRDIKIVEMDVLPHVNKDLEIKQGMIEKTTGYARLTNDNLFDVDSKLNKKQVKEIYCKLERRFAESVNGEVQIPKELLIKGSVVSEICLPILEKNNSVKLLIM